MLCYTYYYGTEAFLVLDINNTSVIAVFYYAREEETGGFLVVDKHLFRMASSVLHFFLRL